MIYAVIFVFIAFWSLFDDFTKNKFIKFVPVVVLIAVAGFRNWDVGLDTPQYMAEYNQMFWGYPPFMNFEPGYTLVEKILAWMQVPVTGFFLVIASISLISIFINFNRGVALPTSALLYYYSRFYLNRDLNQIRSGVAASILLFSIPYLRDRKFWKFSFVVGIATLFHSAALIMLIAYPIAILFDRLKHMGFGLTVTALLLSVGVSYFVTPVLTIVFKIIGKGTAYLTYDRYVDGSGLLNPVVLMQLSLTLISAFIIYKLKQADEQEKMLFIIYFISTVLLISLSQYSVLAGRLSTMLATVEPLILIFVIQKFVKSKLLSNIIMIIVSGLILYVTYYLTGQIQMNFEPYTAFTNLF